MRIIHLFVICALVFAAAYVYRIKMDSTVQTERVIRLRSDIREERNQIAALRAEWAQLSSPGRLQRLAERYLKLRPVEAAQFDQLRALPPRPPNFVTPDDPDPLGTMIDTIASDNAGNETTGSISRQETPR